MEYFIVYLLVTLGSFPFVVIVLPTLGVLVLSGVIAFFHDSDNERYIREKIKEPLVPTYVSGVKKVTKFVLLPCLILSMFIPSKTDLMWIIGLGTGWKVIQNEQVQALPPKLVEFLNKQLEEQIK